MADADPGKSSGGLATRVVAGVLLAAVALFLLWAGGRSFAAFVAAGGVLVLSEWFGLQKVARVPTLVALALLAGAFVVAILTGIANGFIALGAVLALVFVLTRFSPLATAGVLYAGVPVLALLWLRAGAGGFGLALWAMAMVWATDTCAYFAGRAIGGPKIWQRVSPKKTWAGLIGGMAGSAAVSLALGRVFLPDRTGSWLIAAGLLLAVIAQAGDFFESAVKRRAGAKDSGHLIPGHGGIMDRVDGLLPVVGVVALWVVLG